jgi:hypothetical protein
MFFVWTAYFTVLFNITIMETGWNRTQDISRLVQPLNTGLIFIRPRVRFQLPPLILKYKYCDMKAENQNSDVRIDVHCQAMTR